MGFNSAFKGLTAIGLSPGGSSTVHTQTVHRITQIGLNNRTTQITTSLEECGPCPRWYVLICWCSIYFTQKDSYMKFCNPKRNILYTPIYRHSLYFRPYHAHNPPLIQVQSTETSFFFNPERRRVLFCADGSLWYVIYLLIYISDCFRRHCLAYVRDRFRKSYVRPLLYTKQITLLRILRVVWGESADELAHY